MAVSYSEDAAIEVSRFLKERGRGRGIRLKVETSDCDGMAYRLEFVDCAEEHDLVFESHGARIYVDPKSLVYVDGTVIGYARQHEEGGFVINNPNVKNQCGCGDSFYV